MSAVASWWSSDDASIITSNVLSYIFQADACLQVAGPPSRYYCLLLSVSRPVQCSDANPRTGVQTQCNHSEARPTAPTSRSQALHSHNITAKHCCRLGRQLAAPADRTHSRRLVSTSVGTLWQQQRRASESAKHRFLQAPLRSPQCLLCNLRGVAVYDLASRTLPPMRQHPRITHSLYHVPTCGSSKNSEEHRPGSPRSGTRVAPPRHQLVGLWRCQRRSRVAAARSSGSRRARPIIAEDNDGADGTPDPPRVAAPACGAPRCCPLRRCRPYGCGPPKGLSLPPQAGFRRRHPRALLQ